MDFFKLREQIIRIDVKYIYRVIYLIGVKHQDRPVDQL